MTTPGLQLNPSLGHLSLWSLKIFKYDITKVKNVAPQNWSSLNFEIHFSYLW